MDDQPNVLIQHQETSDTSNQSLQDSPEQSIPSYNHPCGDLLDQGRRRDYNDICVPLYKASITGDWEAAKNILDTNREFKDDLLGYSITEDKETALHIATISQNSKFVEHLVDRMTDQQLALQEIAGSTALLSVALTGNVDMAKIMVAKCPQLLTIRGPESMLPIIVAAIQGTRKMVDYLYDEYKGMEGDDWTDHDKRIVFLNCIQADLFGMFQ